jgi:aspartate racemase
MVQDSPVVAIIGGMGPLASAAFISTIYERAASAREQDMPRLLLWSDPTFEDRTTALLGGREQLLARQLQQAIETCARSGATQYVICCVTAHAVLPWVAPRWRAPMVSLPDALLATVIERQRPQLLLCSTGTRRTRLLEQHPLWERARPWLQWPDDDDQEQIHRAIYALKAHSQARMAAAPLIRELLGKYGCRSFVAACTELHLVTREWAPDPPVHWIDPLEIVADRLASPPAAITATTRARVREMDTR